MLIKISVWIKHISSDIISSFPYPRKLKEVAQIFFYLRQSHSFFTAHVTAALGSLQ